MTYCRLIFLSGILIIYGQTGFTQTTNWNLVGGKAIAEKKLTIAGKSQNDIYREIYRWLIKVYKDPEDILKARLDDEYLRGVGYYSNCVKFGALSNASLQYSFSFEIKNEEVIFKIFDAFLIYSYSEVDDGIYPIEDYIFAKKPKKKTRKKDD
ncbi:MAG TPA: hypothetical protein PLM56_03135 [Cyclobacteriaceae bacterium]|nr:DUF4468 domain-containing protein [Cyclobacteriaceae bacterium]HRE65703.1 hypothetical protein [Cyclobacteriaceae bacterium]HRF32468.1 hypothetical protein [Cyclobacteriaceae bacterium]